MLYDPLHDTKVVQHLYEGNEKDDSAQNTSEEPVLIDGVLVEEESCTNLGLPQEVGGEESKPLEDAEASIGLENEKGDGLLEEQTNNDCLPVNVFKSRPHVISNESEPGIGIGLTMGLENDRGKLTRNKTGRRQGQEQKLRDPHT